MFTVITEAEAEREWHQAVAWYEERQPGVGLRLNDRIRAGDQLIELSQCLFFGGYLQILARTSLP